MGENTGESDVSPEQLQEAIDTILGQFSYPEEMTITYRAVDGTTKQTEFIVDGGDDSEQVLTLEHSRVDDGPTVSSDDATAPDEPNS